MLESEIEVEDTIESNLATALSVPGECAYFRLRRAWLNERAFPDILSYELAAVSELVDYVQTSLDTDYAEVEKKFLRRNPRSVGDDEDFSSTLQFPLERLFNIETDRYRYILADYHRTRVIKISMYPLHALERATQSPDLLAPAEVAFARAVVTSDHEIMAPVLERAPRPLRDPFSITLPNGEVQAVFRRPSADGFHVFAAAKDGLVVSLGGGAEITMSAGDVAATRDTILSSLIHKGEVILL